MKFAILLSIFSAVLISSILPDENFSSFPISLLALSNNQKKKKEKKNGKGRKILIRQNATY